MSARSSKRADQMLRRLRRLLFYIFLIAAVLLLLDAYGIIDLPDIKNEPQIYDIPEGSAQVHYIDVGQGDCSLIVSDDGSAMLIDSGESEYSGTVLGYLSDLGIKKLDYVLATHPHSDHMGGMADIISSDIEIGTFIMPKIPDDRIPTTRVYEKMLLALADKGCKVKAAENESVSLGSGTLEFMTAEYSGSNMNNYSVAVKFTFGKRAFLFSGDAEEEIEKELVDAHNDLSADVYKAGHHGSDTSSSMIWLSAIDPDYCVIECGKGNSYGHPDSEAVERMRIFTDVILRTDINGNIVFTTDGDNIEYKTSEEL